jgi:hypothetical protein
VSRIVLRSRKKYAAIVASVRLANATQATHPDQLLGPRPVNPGDQPANSGDRRAFMYYVSSMHNKYRCSLYRELEQLPTPHRQHARQSSSWILSPASGVPWWVSSWDTDPLVSPSPAAASASRAASSSPASAPLPAAAAPASWLTSAAAALALIRPSSARRRANVAISES